MTAKKISAALGFLFAAFMAMAVVAAFFRVQDASATAPPQNKLGCQKTGENSWACDTQTDLTVLDAGSWQNAFKVSVPFTAFQTHEQMDITALVRFRTAPGGDASTLGGFQLRRMDGQYENGTFTGFGGDASDTLLSAGMGNSWLDSGSRLVQCTAIGQTECVQVFCERPCQISLSTSYDVNLAGAPIDSGTPDSADGSDSAPPSPFITQIIPNAGTAGQAVTIKGGNFATGSGTTFTVTNSSAGQSSLTSVSCSSTSQCTGVMPAYGAANGTGGTGSSLTATVTGTGATGNGNGSTLGCAGGNNLGLFFYYDTNTPIAEYFRADVGITTGSAGTGTVTSWVDNIAALAMTNCTNGPTYTVTSLNGSGLPAITTSGTSQCMTYTSAVSGAESTAFVVAHYYTTAAQVLLSTNSANAYWFIPSAAADYEILTLDSTVASNTGTHIFIGTGGAGTSGQFAQVDSTSGPTGTPSAKWAGANVIGCYQTGACTGVNAAHADIGEILAYGGSAYLTTAQIARNQSIMKANWCTP